MRPSRNFTARATLAPVALIAGFALSACGASETVTDAAAAADEPTPTSTATPSESTGVPSLEPGSYPLYGNTDYSYELRLQCFCPAVGQPIAVTVTDGEVLEAVWARKSPDHAAGAPAGEWAALTINQIIEKANDPKMATVLVDWEPGSDYPTKVSLDQNLQMVDEEITYLISDVQPAQ